SSGEEEEEVEPASLHVQPTKEQRRARHGISKKLPEFNGKPQDWPRFYGAFLASNKACGFTNNENLVRLQECQKGPAFELVRGRLITAEFVPRVIEKLVQVYGRPKLILHSLLKEEWTTKQRQNFVVKHNLCRLCLNGHQGRCFAPKRCNIGDCDQMHHPLLHDQVGSKLVEGISAHVNMDDCMLFRVVPVDVHYNGTKLTVLVFLDEGAFITLVERQLVERLGAGGVPERLTLRWTAGIERVEKASQRLSLTISSVGSLKLQKLKDARTVERLELPHQRVDPNKLKERYAHLKSIPIASYQGKTELMVGIHNIDMFKPLEVVSGEVNDAIAVRTKLGWSVYGYTKFGAGTQTNNSIDHHSVTNEDLDLLIREHYRLEESVITIPNDSAKNKRAKELLEQTTRVGERFETGLLWKESVRNFPESYSMAVKRFKQLETKLKKTPELHNNLQ
uniref:Peptidase aspartic putative domain-containing protein n=1 Tax=Anopheles funestus TaxID=62324 RepID=A0A182RMF3_ANOFN